MSGSDDREKTPAATEEPAVVNKAVVKEALVEILNEIPAFRSVLTKQTPPPDPHKKGNSSQMPDPPQTPLPGGTGRSDPRGLHTL